ncbi:hypothetical protein [Holzapfeliella floricola]|uniref:hypothetical protein n=1 Tax=Holzapfeliella floricola TaxID=679249 RepID=UPI000A9992B9|nr:hypothetical protein [Holzapfeliella floricola]
MNPKKRAAVKKLPASHILLFAITNLNILASSAVIAGLGARILEHAGSKANSEVTRVMFSSTLYIIMGIFSVLILSFIYSLIRTLLNYYDFRIARTGNTLTIKSGLLKEKNATNSYSQNSKCSSEKTSDSSFIWFFIYFSLCVQWSR